MAPLQEHFSDSTTIYSNIVVDTFSRELTHRERTEVELPHVRLQGGLEKAERDGGAEDAEGGQHDGGDPQD